MVVPDIADRLAVFCRAHWDRARVGSVTAMPGHSGLSFGFELAASPGRRGT